MASTFSLFFTLLTFSLLTTTSTAEISLRELESVIFALRANGYHLFGNSIAVSDLSFQILSLRVSGDDSGAHAGFTFLAPPNSALFSLNMAGDAFSYVHSLRYHVVPRRFSFADLRNLSYSPSPYLETLVPGHLLSVSYSGDFVAIDGVRVSFPDLYLRSDIAAHGLDGLLSSSTGEHLRDISPVSIPPTPFTNGASSPPSVQEYSISIPPATGEVFSSDSDRFNGAPSPSPERYSISPPESHLCGDWNGCDTDYFAPELAPVTMAHSPESLMTSHFKGREKNKEEMNVGGHEEKKQEYKTEESPSPSQGQGQSQSQSQGAGEGDLNFAKYNQFSVV